MHRRADSRHHVFTLRVEQEIAVEDLLARGRIAREANSGARIISRIPKNHLHDIYGGSQQAGDVFHAAIGHGFFRHPGFKHGADGAPELLRRDLPEKAGRVFCLK